jgi:Type ISP C-terminal specificity domain
VGSDHQTFLATSHIIDYKCGISGNAGLQSFPFYTYAEDGSNRRENITDWALKQFQDRYGSQVSKWDIFHYVYGLLHHPQYRERYKENLKRDLPHIPLLHSHEAFKTCKHIGQQLMDLHLNYEQAKEYPLTGVENRDVPFSWRVEKMKLTQDKTAVIVNESLTLSGIPQECFQYRLGNRSALEWVIDQYQVSEDKRSGIVSDPNQLEDEEYIVRLVGKVVTVSVETVRLVKELEQTVTQEDWLSQEIRGSQLIALEAILAEEEIHTRFAKANGGVPATNTFSFPHGAATFTNRQLFLETQQLAEELTNGALLAWIKDTASMNMPHLAQIGGQLMQVEGGHRVVGRVIAQSDPWDNWGFGPVTLNHFLDVPAAVKAAGFLSPVPGNSFTYKPTRPSFPGVINTHP